MQTATLRYEMVQTRGLRFEVAQHGRGERLALLLHGFPECAYSYRFQVPLLERLGFRVWAVNMRGYGKSDKPRGRRAYAMDALERDVCDLVDASGASSVLLIGHDWGGAVAWSVGGLGLPWLQQLVIMNSPHPACFMRELRSADQLRRSWYMLFGQLPWLPERLLRAGDYRLLRKSLRHYAVHPEAFSDADLAVYRDNASQPGALTAMLNYYRALPWSMRLSKQRGAPKIRVPTLLVWGERDHALGRQLTHGTEQFVDDLSVCFIPDASHWVQQDAPQQVNAALEAWLNRPAAERAATQAPGAR